MTSNTPLPFLISWAFNLEDGRLFGIPKGADSARFDIVAKAPTDTLRPGELQLMMCALLAERFGLITHQEQRTMTSYVLARDRDAVKV